MFAPDGISMGYGKTGTQYVVVNGSVFVDPDDVSGFRSAGFTLAEI
jgi:hypothetical protein